jgi:hypothetical protein
MDAVTAKVPPAEPRSNAEILTREHLFFSEIVQKNRFQIPRHRILDFSRIPMLI